MVDIHCTWFDFQVARLKDQHKEEISRLYTDLEDESTSRSSMDRRLTELRTEVNYHMDPLERCHQSYLKVICVKFRASCQLKKIPKLCIR